MKISHEQELKELFGKFKGRLMWNPNEDTAKVVISITKREDEPGLCANFSDGLYISLDNAEVSEFVIAHRLTID